MVHTPTIMDVIYVHWQIEDAPVWWPAIVIEINDLEKPKGRVHASGRLLYQKYRSYSPEEADVTFLYCERGGRVVKQRYAGRFLEMSWSPQQDVAPNHRDRQSTTQTGNHAQPPPSTSRDRMNGNQSSQKEPSTLTAGSDAAPHVQHAQCDQLDKGQSLDVSDRHLQTPGNSGIAPAVVSTANIPDQPSTTQVTLHSTSLFLSKLLESSREYMHLFGQSSFHEQLSDLILHELRVDVVNELHRNFRMSPSPTERTQALQQKSLRVSIPCSLETFSAVAKQIHSSSVTPFTCFFPSFSHTQNPSIASPRFTVFFRGISELSTTLRFNDNRDFATLYWREKSNDGVIYTRVLGSMLSEHSSYTAQSSASHVMSDKSTLHGTPSKGVSRTVPSELEEEKQEASTHGHCDKEQGRRHIQQRAEQQADHIFVGLSMHASIVEKEQPLSAVGPSSPRLAAGRDDKRVTNSPTMTKSDLHIMEVDNALVLKRNRDLRDDATHSYLSPWLCVRPHVSITVPKQEHFIRKDKKIDGVFALRWHAKDVPRTPAWTSDALRTGCHTLGKLEVVIPWVLVSGEHCTEVGDILSSQEFTLRG